MCAKRAKWSTTGATSLKGYVSCGWGYGWQEVWQNERVTAVAKDALKNAGAFRLVNEVNGDLPLATSA